MDCANCPKHQPLERRFGRNETMALVAAVLSFLDSLPADNRANIVQMLIALDVAVNQKLPGPGPTVAGETVSERVALAARRGDVVGIVACRLLDYFDANHCEKSIRMARGGDE